MLQSKHSTPLPKGGDRFTVIIGMAIATACLYQIDALCGIPFPVAVLIVPVSFFMFYGMQQHRQDLSDQRHRAQGLGATTLLERKILFRARFRDNESGGTAWEIKNANPFGWHNAKLLIERRHQDEKVSGKVELGDVPAGGSVIVESDVSYDVISRWRVMVICHEGQMLDFPDRWTENDPLKRR